MRNVFDKIKTPDEWKKKVLDIGSSDYRYPMKRRPIMKAFTTAAAIFASVMVSVIVYIAAVSIVNPFADDPIDTDRATESVTNKTDEELIYNNEDKMGISMLVFGEYIGKISGRLITVNEKGEMSLSQQNFCTFSDEMGYIDFLENGYVYSADIYDEYRLYSGKYALNSRFYDDRDKWDIIDLESGEIIASPALSCKIEGNAVVFNPAGFIFDGEELTVFGYCAKDGATADQIIYKIITYSADGNVISEREFNWREEFSPPYITELPGYYNTYSYGGGFVCVDIEAVYHIGKDGSCEKIFTSHDVREDIPSLASYQFEGASFFGRTVFYNGVYYARILRSSGIASDIYESNAASEDYTVMYGTDGEFLGYILHKDDKISLCAADGEVIDSLDIKSNGYLHIITSASPDITYNEDNGGEKSDDEIAEVYETAFISGFSIEFYVPSKDHRDSFGGEGETLLALDMPEEWYYLRANGGFAEDDERNNYYSDWYFDENDRHIMTYSDILFYPAGGEDFAADMQNGFGTYYSVGGNGLEYTFKIREKAYITLYFTEAAERHDIENIVNSVRIYSQNEPDVDYDPIAFAYKKWKDAMHIWMCFHVSSTDYYTTIDDIAKRFDEEGNLLPMEWPKEISFDDEGYLPVTLLGGRIDTYEKLVDYVHSLFSDEIADAYIANSSYKDKNGKLWVMDGTMGWYTSYGVRAIRYIRESEDKIILRLSIDDIGYDAKSEEFDMLELVLERIGEDDWRWTSFQIGY